jgi:hypothetical protein
VLTHLAPPARPFVAALPQAALANPEGPLGIIGHVDLAWSHTFLDLDGVTSRAPRFLEVLAQLTSGKRAGVALRQLQEGFLEANHDLCVTYDDEEDARVSGRENPVDPLARAYLWLLRNDLGSFVLLGDPAARVSFRR